MELFKNLFGVMVVVVLICDVTAQHHWMLPQQQNQPPLPSQWPQQPFKVPPPAALFDKCQVTQENKIQCGTEDITAKQCENINCCFDGQQCYYGKAGVCSGLVSSASKMLHGKGKVSAATFNFLIYFLLTQ